ncbi:2OG-Fe(II) oxygenase [Litoribrevibacter albus]|uniref:Prolyl 4-hydroxylase subunit alpha n=1 Tax=Litoribrevibacter albus TaxID=1473156 RepID=A0AA37S7J3_9GAMM|nr:2OG-Fe(II) oxygenase [Litoribrevibacter albus]GLQ29663.1 prolyl 4-hydroxylase subunit alpha [Litoribrevibacter albus]
MPKHALLGDDNSTDETLFARIAEDIEQRGFSINPVALPPYLNEALLARVHEMGEEKFSGAGIGRGEDYVQSEFVRTDEICWINGESLAGKLWLEWTGKLQHYLNRRLFLGLFSFESHFAHYGTGDYYKRHLDAFKGEANRVLSVVTYLNSGWTAEDGGELVLYQDEQDREGIKVTPLNGTVVVFLSEEFPHEVLPASRDRYSIAGWYRVNTSVGNKIDPPV